MEKTLKLGKTDVRRRTERKRIRFLYGITDSMDMNLSKLRQWKAEEPDMLQSME